MIDVDTTPMGNLQDRIEEIIKKGDSVSGNEVEPARRALKQAINSIASEIGILRRERWTYERTCVSLPPNLNDESIDVRIDVLLEGTLDLLVDPKELEARKVGWKPLGHKYSRGVLGKYSKLVGSASKGAVCE